MRMLHRMPVSHGTLLRSNTVLIVLRHHSIVFTHTLSIEEFSDAVKGVLHIKRGEYLPLLRPRHAEADVWCRFGQTVLGALEEAALCAQAQFPFNVPSGAGKIVSPGW